MIKKATFYILKKTDLKSRDLFLCRLVEKIYITKQRIYINIGSSAEMQNIDTQLWTFRDISFIPHEIFDTKNASCQILLGTAIIPPKEHNEVLLNLAREIPQFHEAFSHIIEVIPEIEDLKIIGRQHYKFYQQNNYEITTHEIV
jgi:DNA polymerase III subunit chi